MDDVWKRDEIESPCINICVIDPTHKTCVGCGRTGQEIAKWSSMNHEERRAIMLTLPKRIQDNKPARRGGRGRVRND